jgi:hypothetical protein
LQCRVGLFARIAAVALALANLNNLSANTLLVRQDGTGNYTTIQAAVNAMAAKDTVLVGPGTYAERITFPAGKSGVAGSLTTLKTETPGTVETWGFDTANCNFLHIEGFNVSVPTNLASDSGIAIQSSNLEIVSNYVHDTLGVGIYSLYNYNNNRVIGNHIYNIGMGIIIWGTNCTVAGNDIERLRYYSPLGDADFIIFFGSNLELSNNFLHGSAASEIGPAHVDGFSSWDNNAQFVQHVRIENNRMQDFYHEGFIVAAAYYSNSYDIVICNNIFQGAQAWGVLAFNNLQNVQVYNNLFKDIPSNPVGINANASGAVYNNIFNNCTGWDSATSPAIGGNNIWYNPGGYIPGHFNGDLLNVNPLFVSTNDFHLQSNSPAIDAGVVATVVPYDIAGTPRPQGKTWDIGVYEYVPGGGDTKPPVLSAVTATVVSNTATTISWNTDEAANGRVDYGTTTNYGSFVTNGALVLQHSFTLTSLTTGTLYHYRVRSTDASGNTTNSADFTFSMTPTAPAITSQPLGLTNIAGATATFSVTATGTGPLSYQWQFNNGNLANGGQFSGATSNTLTVTNLQLANIGNYQVVVTNGGGAVTSVMATLGVILPGACQSAPSGIVGWWPGDGSANDIIGTNNGVLQGGATASAAGEVGSAFSFDGTNGFVRIPDAPELRPTNFTIEAWVQFASLDSAGAGSPAGNQYIVFKQNPLSANFEGYALTKTRTTNGDVFALAIASSSGQEASIQAVTLLTTGVWYHVAAVRGSNTTQLFVNGRLEAQGTISFPQSYGAYPLYFGTSGESNWDRKLSGRLDEVSLYNRALSATEILAIYAAGTGGKCKVTAAPPRFVTSSMQNGNLVFTLSGSAGHSYGILASSNEQSWVQVTNVTLTNGSATFSLPVPGNNQFYRAMLLQ